MIQDYRFCCYKFILEGGTLSAGMSAFFTHQSGTLSSGITGTVWFGITGTVYSGISGTVWSGLFSLGQQWDMGTNGWMDDSKEFYTYQNGNQTQLLIQEWSNSQWKNAARISYTYGITAIAQTILPAGENIVVYPNPSKGEITISGNTASVSNISIFDQEGRLVKTIAKGESLTGINLKGLSNGIYFIQAGKPGNGQGARFVLQK